MWRTFAEWSAVMSDIRSEKSAAGILIHPSTFFQPVRPAGNVSFEQGSPRRKKGGSSGRSAERIERMLDMDHGQREHSFPDSSPPSAILAQLRDGETILR